MAYIFQKIAADKPSDMVREDARRWFRETASKLTSRNVSTSRLLQTGKENLQSSISVDDIGRMFMFMYDPKLKDVLPYYDTFPLCIPIEIYDDGFLGLNLHYLPPRGRAALFDSLLDAVSNDKYDKTTRLRVTYKILKGASRFSGFEPCVKRYLAGQVRSKFLYVDPENWDMAVMLPTERFKGARKSTIWWGQ